jgi:preprotein translocase subunit SecF
MKQTGRNKGKGQKGPSKSVEQFAPHGSDRIEAGVEQATTKSRRVIDFAGRRKIWYLISLILIIPGLISLAAQGLNLGIDFTGGSMLHIRVSSETIDTGQVRTAVESFGLEKAPGIQSSGPQEFLIRTEELSQERMTELVGSLQTQLGNVEVLRHENVGALIGEELARNALYALGIAAVLMLLYITLRFEFRFGLAAVLALLHDALVVIGVFSLFQIEVDGAFVAAILTVLGYSINDTIVIFDRIRENRKNYPRLGLLDLVNRSVTQTLTRSINTSLTVIFCLVALLVFGGSTIQIFALALLIGVTVGVYSSICIASPLWLDLTEMNRNKGRKLAPNAR